MYIPLKQLMVVGGLAALGSGVWYSPALAEHGTRPKPATVTVNNAKDVPVVV